MSAIRWSDQAILLAMLREGPVLLSQLCHWYRAADRIANLRKVLAENGSPYRIEGRWVMVKGKLGMLVKDREYRLVREVEHA